jgi:hypothetical protein
VPILEGKDRSQRRTGQSMYWLGVVALYLSLLGVGLFLGHWLSSRFQGRGGNGGQHRLVPPKPAGPSHAREWLPLGSDFDRTFLPGAFAPEHSAELV